MSLQCVSCELKFFTDGLVKVDKSCDTNSLFCIHSALSSTAVTIVIRELSAATAIICRIEIIPFPVN